MMRRPIEHQLYERKKESVEDEFQGFFSNLNVFFLFFFFFFALLVYYLTKIRGTLGIFFFFFFFFVIDIGILGICLAEEKAFLAEPHDVVHSFFFIVQNYYIDSGLLQTTCWHSVCIGQLEIWGPLKFIWWQKFALSAKKYIFALYSKCIAKKLDANNFGHYCYQMQSVCASIFLHEKWDRHENSCTWHAHAGIMHVHAVIIQVLHSLQALYKSVSSCLQYGRKMPIWEAVFMLREGSTFSCLNRKNIRASKRHEENDLHINLKNSKREATSYLKTRDSWLISMWKH